MKKGRFSDARDLLTDLLSKTSDALTRACVYAEITSSYISQAQRCLRENQYDTAYHLLTEQTQANLNFAIEALLPLIYNWKEPDHHQAKALQPFIALYSDEINQLLDDCQAKRRTAEINTAWAALRSDNIQQALDIFQANNNSHGMARAYYQKGDYQKALEAIAPFCRDTSSDPKYLLLQAHCFCKMDYKKQACEIFESLMINHPHYQPALTSYGRYLVEINQRREAIKIFQKATTFSAMVSLAHCYEALGEHALALDYCGNLLKIGPGRSEIVFLQATLAIDLDVKEIYLKQILERFSKDNRAICHVGYEYLKLDLIDDAIMAFTMVLSLMPHHYAARLGYYRCLAQTNSPKEERNRAKEAVKQLSAKKVAARLFAIRCYPLRQESTASRLQALIEAYPFTIKAHEDLCSHYYINSNMPALIKHIGDHLDLFMHSDRLQQHAILITQKCGTPEEQIELQDRLKWLATSPPTVQIVSLAQQKQHQAATETKELNVQDELDDINIPSFHALNANPLLLFDKICEIPEATEYRDQLKPYTDITGIAGCLQKPEYAVKILMHLLKEFGGGFASRFLSKLKFYHLLFVFFPKTATLISTDADKSEVLDDTFESIDQLRQRKKVSSAAAADNGLAALVTVSLLEKVSIDVDSVQIDMLINEQIIDNPILRLLNIEHQESLKRVVRSQLLHKIKELHQQTQSCSQPASDGVFSVNNTTGETGSDAIYLQSSCV